MSGEARPTTFVTGAAGFIGMQLVKLLIQRGYSVLGLTNSPEAADRVRRAGAVAVMGDLLATGRWQDEAAADWVFHVPPPPGGSNPSVRMRMDGHLLDAVAAGGTKRVVYVANASAYGPTGSRAVTEDEPARPSTSARTLAPILERVEGYHLAGLPIVTALPGRVYGNGSWFRAHVIDPVLAGRPVLRAGKAGPWISTVHVHDCVRALVHLAESGERGGRYFVVNTAPVRLYQLADTFARLADRPLRAWSLSAIPACVGRRDEEVRGDAVLSNIRLRGIGFHFEYPTIEDGLRQVVRELQR